MRLNVWEILLNILHTCSNRQIFGVFGDAINPLADALRRDQKKHFEWIGVRHEEVGAFAAAAQAKITGRLGLCAGTVGPGAIHLLNGLYDAKMDRAPVLAMTGQVPREEMGTEYHQEVNLDRLFSDVSVYNETIVLSEQMPRLGLLAVQTALAQQGVSHLSIPSDVGPLKNISDSLQHAVFQSSGKIMPCHQELESIAHILNNSSKITLMVGWGARGASTEVLSLAKQLQAPIVHSLKGKTVISQSNSYWCGGIGLLGSTSGMDALDTAETILMLGTDFPYRQFYPKGTTIIQIDRAPERLGKRCAVTLGVVGDLQLTLQGLLPLLQKKESSDYLKAIQKKRDAWLKLVEKRSQRTNKKYIHPQYLARLIDQYANDSAVFTADTGETIIWLARQIQMKGSRDFIASFNHASMANAFAQAIGVQALDRDRQVIALCGDGGFTMLMGDFITAVNYKLPIKVFVFNNGKLGFVKMEMEASGYPAWGVTLKNPNLADCARAMGGEGIRVTQTHELEPAIKKAFETDAPVLVDVLTNPDEMIVPPKLMPAKAWGYSISKMKELWLESE